MKVEIILPTNAIKNRASTGYADHPTAKFI